MSSFFTIKYVYNCRGLYITTGRLDFLVATRQMPKSAFGVDSQKENRAFKVSLPQCEKINRGYKPLPQCEKINRAFKVSLPQEKIQ